MRPSRIRRLLNVFLLLSASLFICACAEDTDSSVEGPDKDPSQVNSQNVNPELFTATQQTLSDSMRYALAINGKAIPLSEIDKRIELKLFDLEWAGYELRKAALSEYLAEQSKIQPVQSATVLLEPPAPPRIILSPGQQATALRFRDMNTSSPLRLSVFCNYQSSHCARIQSVYQQIRDHYGELVAFEFYDLPLAFHQFALSASHAVRCAHSMGEFEGFHKALWLHQQALNEASYLILAKQLKLDEVQFRACMKNQSYALAIDAHRILGETLGFNQVPVTLVNGLYVSGPKEFEVFQFYIDQELRRLGYQTTPSPSSQANSSNDSNQGQSMAEEIESGAAEPAEHAVARDLPADMPDPDTLEYKARPVVPAAGEIPLSRDWLDDQLLQQAELESHFKPAEHEVEGVRLSKLSGVGQSEFYQTLGLQEGDVLMRVNEQWVHESQNDLFTLLENAEQVSVVLVRKGLPVHLVYRIRD